MSLSTLVTGNTFGPAYDIFLDAARIESGDGERVTSGVLGNLSQETESKCKSAMPCILLVFA